MKRAVRLPYVDFSAAELRKAACERELSLNRRTAPELYKRVVAVRRDPSGELHLDGAGEPVDWLVEMKAFDQAQLLDRLAKAGSLPSGTARELGDTIAAFHDGAEVTPEFGGASAIENLLTDNAALLAAPPSDTFDPKTVDDVIGSSKRAFLGLRTLLDRRRGQGRVRRCHGDLHLGNICLIDGHPVLFDCLEFDEQLSNIDVLYDLAFLLMDLLEHGLAGDANMVLNRYLDRRSESEGFAALPLFLALRAVIRAHVTITRDPSAKAEANAYLTAAQGFLHTPSLRLIAIGGLSGSGKSTLAYRLAPEVGAAPGARVIRSDVIRKRLFGVSPETPLAAEAYTTQVTERVYQGMLDEAARCLAGRHSAILDAVFLRPEERSAAAELARKTGTAFTGFWLEAPAALMEKRIEGRRNDASDADAGILRRQLAIDPGPLDWTRIDAAGDAAGAVRASLD